MGIPLTVSPSSASGTWSGQHVTNVPYLGHVMTLERVTKEKSTSLACSILPLIGHPRHEVFGHRS